MALPLNIGTLLVNSACGPFKSSNGSYYVIGNSASVAGDIRVVKATDPTSSFSTVTSIAGSAITDGPIFAIQSGDKIHCVWAGSGYYFRTFDMASETWGSTQTFSANVNSDPRCGIVERSNGDIVVIHPGTSEFIMGTAYFRARYSVRTSGVWASSVEIGTQTGVSSNFQILGAALGASDTVHFFYSDSANSTIVQRALNSSNTLQTATTTANSFSFPNFGGMAVSYVSGGTTKVVAVTQTGNSSGSSTAKALYFDSASSPTINTATIASSVNYPLAASVDVSQGVVYALYLDNATKKIFIRSSSDNGATWSAASTFSTTVFFSTSSGAADVGYPGPVYQQGSNYVVGSAYGPVDSGGGVQVTYDQYTARAAGTNVSVSVTGISSAGSIGSVTTSAKANIEVTGIIATGFIGTATTSAASVTAVTGTSATGTANTATVTGLANVPLTGVSSSGSAGTVSVTTTANTQVSVSGVAATGAVGTVAVSYGASATTAGVVTTGSIGSASISTAQSISVFGVAASGQAGTAEVAYGVSIPTTGISATGEIGTVDVSGAGDVLVYPAGVSGTGAVGAVTASAQAATSVGGVEAYGQCGNASASGSATAVVLGVSASGSATAPTVTTTVNTTVTGTSSSGAIGTATINLGAAANVNGVAGAGSVGSITVSSAQVIDVSGTSGTTAVGSVIIAIGAQAQVSGISAAGSTGSVRVELNASALVAGVQAIGRINDNLLIWGLVDTGQTPNWSPISGAQTPGWTEIATPQSPNWTQIAA